MRALLLAGGEGSRLWPLSRKRKPKQFLSLGEPLSLLQRSLKRLLDAPCITSCSIIASVAHQREIEEELQALKLSKPVRLIGEPAARNTAAAIAFAIDWERRHHPEDEETPILVIPSDHWIVPEELFFRGLEEAAKLLSKEEWITFGMKPTKPETGYGYIERGALKNTGLFEVFRFIEKPTLSKAEEYLAAGTFFWNMGIFLFFPSFFWSEVKLHAPSLFAHFQQPPEEIVKTFPRLPSISVDYALLEKSVRVSVFPLDLTWSDIGSWDALYELLEKDGDENVIHGSVSALETKKCLLWSEKRLITTLGVEDLIVIETEDALYIGKRGESQKMKQLVQQLTHSGRGEV